MKFFENKRTQSERKMYLFGFCIYRAERKAAREQRLKMQGLQKFKAILQSLEKYCNKSHPLPSARKQIPANTVWQLWFQGEENAPALIQRCLRSVQHYTSGRPYVLLTQDNLQEYLDIPDYILKKHKEGIFSTTHLSDLIRLLLLEQYGGTWIDATVLLTAPIPAEVENAPFFVFKSDDWSQYPAPPSNYDVLLNLLPANNPYQCCSSWFMHASAHHPIIRKVAQTMLSYWQTENTLIHYFLLHQCITLAVTTDTECGQLFFHSPTRSNHFPHILQRSLDIPFEPSTFEEIKRMSFAHKLTHRHDAVLFPPGSYYHHLFTMPLE